MAETRPNSNKWWELALHPFLVFAYPFVFLGAQNASEVPVQFVVRSLLIPVFVIAALLWILGFWLKSYRKAGLCLTVCILFFHFLKFGGSIPQQAEVSAALTLLGVGLIWFFVKVARDTVAAFFTTALNIAAVGLLLWNAVDWGAQVVKGRQVVESVKSADPSEFQLSLNERYDQYPDIFYIVLDGYGRQDVLRNLYDFDNSGFIEFLRNKGFFVGKESKSNYSHTILSLSSSLNYSYLDGIARETGVDSVNWTPLANMIKKNRVETLLKSVGYKSVYFHLGIYNFDDYSKDFYIKDPTQYDDVEVAVERDMDKRNINTRKKVLNVLDNLPHLDHIEEPKFVYAHVLSPHDPFVFGPNGEALNPKGQFTWLQDPLWQFGPPISKSEYRKGYADQVTYLNKKVVQIVERLLEDEENPPVIIIQGDHGPKSNFNWNDPDKTDLYERMGILNAIYIPHRTLSLNSDISPVNTFRVVLNELFDADMALLPDISYYSGYYSPYLMYNVTDIANKASTESAEPAAVAGLSEAEIVTLAESAAAAMKDREYPSAIALYQQLLPSVSDRFGVYKELAKASAGIGDVDAAIAYTERCYSLRIRETENSIVEISTPFWHSPEFFQAGITYYEAMEKRLPNRVWLQQNIDTLKGRLSH